MKAPFPWFGGKSRVAPLVWERFGKVDNYVEPFFGSGAVLLGSPRVHRFETINDLDGMIANFWRAVAQDAEQVVKYCDWPVNENDLHARHAWLIGQRDDLTRRLEGDPDYYDPKIAGWWVWGICCWIGGGFCLGRGPWTVQDGRLVKGGDGPGVKRQLIHLGNTGQGVNRQLIHLGNTGHVVHDYTASLHEWFAALQNRLRRVRVCCGDWSRVCGPTPTVKLGLTAVFLDPPYGVDAHRDSNIYAKESLMLTDEIREWCVQWQDHPLMRVALCGYEGEYDLPDWDVVAWKASGGRGSQSKQHDNPNAWRERIWFSPHCLKGEQCELF